MVLFILLCKVVLVAHKTLRFDRYFTVTSDNIRIQRLVHQIKSFISCRRMSNQLILIRDIFLVKKSQKLPARIGYYFIEIRTQKGDK